MKPYITPELTIHGKKAFKFQLEGLERKDIESLLKGQKLVAYGLPNGHTFQAVWDLSFFFESGLVVHFSSACSEAGGWQEVGSLNIGCSQAANSAAEAIEMEFAVTPSLQLTGMQMLVFEDEDVVVECGLVLHGVDGQELVVAAGIPPGSVSVLASFAADKQFEPQFSLSSCRRERI